MAGAVLNGLNIPEEKCISFDRPDIIVPKENNESIGIEVVSYRATGNAESEDALYKVLSEYGGELDKELKTKYELTVLFHGAELRSDLNYKRVKKQLFKEMENCRLNLPEKAFNEYISSVEFYEVPNLEKTFVGMSAAFEYDNVDESILEDIISKKEEKLKDYKTLDIEYNITEWWLVIFFPTIEQTDFSKFQLTKELNTNYDHVYLAEPGNLYMTLK